MSYPAASPDVVAVGGTSLVQATNTGTRNATETVWSGAGQRLQRVRAEAGVADRHRLQPTAPSPTSRPSPIPNTGVWVYDSVAAGTCSAARASPSPIIGAMYALAGNGASTDDLSVVSRTPTPRALNDVVSGSNGTCGGSYLCTGAVGYDGPTGLGTPNTAAPFAASGLGTAHAAAVTDSRLLDLGRGAERTGTGR